MKNLKIEYTIAEHPKPSPVYFLLSMIGMKAKPALIKNSALISCVGTSGCFTNDARAIGSEKVIPMHEDVYMP